jgi:hypothetical protein
MNFVLPPLQTHPTVKVLPKQPPVTPLSVTLAALAQTPENTATLGSLVVTLTRRVKHKSCVCHSYEKHPGWGIPRKRKKTYNAHSLPTFSTSSTYSTRASTRNPLCFHATTHDFRHHGGVRGVFTSFAAISLLCHNHRACRATEPGDHRPARNLLKP